jgi:hypothetical protein
MTEVSTLVQQGIAAVKSGRRDEARDLLMQAVELDDHNEQAWLWLSGVAEGIEDQIICLENVLVINPGNTAAERGLRQLRAKFPPAPEPPAPKAEPPAGQRDQTLARETIPASADAAGVVEPESPPPYLDLEDSRTCVYCGAANPAARPDCAVCGRPLDTEDYFISNQPVVAPAAVEVEAPDEVRFVRDFDTRPQGLMSLIASWIAALSFNRRGAYEHEVFSASAGRTVGGIILGGVIIPFLISLVAGILLASSISLNWLAILPPLAATPFVAIPAVIALIVQFYLWAGGLYLVAWAFGGKASFAVHTHLVSVAYAASGLLGSFAFLVGGAILVAMVDVRASGDPSGLGPLALIGPAALGLIIALYTGAMHGQALSAAHRFSWLGGVGVLVLSTVLYGLLIILSVMLVLLLTDLALPDLALPLSR